MERLKRQEPVEKVMWTNTTVRGIQEPRARLTQGILFRCVGCGRMFGKHKAAREHAVYECKELMGI